MTPGKTYIGDTMKLLILTTGGTIGSTFDGTAVDVAGACPAAEQYKTAHPDDGIEGRRVTDILSEEIALSDFERLAQAIYAVDTKVYGGVILTCGSDTLAYIAAFVGLLCADFDIPVMIVAANRVLSDPASNGYVNFDCAAELIRAGVRGVLVPYRNTDGVLYVHEATALRQADYGDDFLSLYGDAYAVFDGALRERRAYRPERIPAGVFSPNNPPGFTKKVLLIHPYPGMDYAAIHTEGYDAVLHAVYHSGTLDAKSYCAWAKSLQNPAYLCSLRSGQKPYRTTLSALGTGMRALYDTSPECAYMKLLLAVNQQTMSVDAFMETEEG